MKLEFKTTVREIIRGDKNTLILKCGQPNEDDDFEIRLRMDAITYNEFLISANWPDPKDHLKIKIELEQVK